MIFKILYVIAICVLLFVVKFSVGVTFGLLRELWRLMIGGEQELNSCAEMKSTNNGQRLSGSEILFVLGCVSACIATILIVMKYTTIGDILSVLCCIVFVCWVVTFFSLVVTRRLSVQKGEANPAILVSALVLLQLFMVGGMIFFIVSGAGSYTLNKYVTLANLRFPLGELCDFDIDSNGQFYCAVGSPGRVQVYSPEGNFIRGWFVGNGGRDFKINIDPNDMVHVYLHIAGSKPAPCHYIYSHKGELIESLYSPKKKDVSFSRNARASHKGVLYQMRGRHMFPVIERIEPDNDRIIVVSDPFYLWFIKSPFPTFAYAFPSILLLIFSKRVKLIGVASGSDDMPGKSDDGFSEKEQAPIALLRADKLGARPYRRLALILTGIVGGTIILGIFISIGLTCHPELVFFGMCSIVALVVTAILLTAVTSLVCLRRPHMKQLWSQRVVLICVGVWFVVLIVVVCGVVYFGWELPWFENPR